MPKPASFSSDDEDEKTTIESGGWEEEASTTVEQGEVADKIRALGLGGSAGPARPTTGITSTTGGVSTGQAEELTVDDQRGAAVLAKLPQQQIPRLVITQGNDAGQAIEIRPGKTYTIGRGVDNDLVLTDIAVSRKHFDIRADPGTWVLTDRGSGNGTLINNRIEDAAFLLASGDVIEIGNTVFRFDVPNGVPRAAQTYDGSIDADHGDDDLEMSTVSGKPLSETAAAGAFDPPRPRARELPAVSPIPPTPPVLPAPPMVAAPYGLDRAAAPVAIPPPGPTQPLARPKTLPPPSPRARTQSTRPPFPSQRPPTQPPPLPPPARMTGGMAAAMPPPAQLIGANLPGMNGRLPPAAIVETPLAGPTTIPGQGVMLPPPSGMHPARLPFSYPVAPSTNPGVNGLAGLNGQMNGYNGRPSQPSALGQPIGSLGSPIGGAPMRPSRLTGPMNSQMNGPMSGQMPMRPSMQIASALPAREAPSTALVQPMSYGGGVQPVAASPSTFASAGLLSRKVKLAIGGLGLALFAALSTIAIIKATSHDPSPDSPEVGRPVARTVEPITPAPPVAKPPVATKPPVTRPAVPRPNVAPIAPQVAQPAPQVAQPVAPKPAQPQVAVVAPPPVTPTPPPVTPTPPPVATRPVEPPPVQPHIATTPTRRPDRPPEKSPEKRVAVERTERPDRTERPEHTETRPAKRSGKSASELKSEAAARYRAKDFAGAAQLINGQLSSFDAGDAQDLKGMANVYSQLGRAYNVGMAPGTKATEAYAAIGRALNLDHDAGSAFVSELEERQSTVAIRAAGSFLASHEYEAASGALRTAEGLGSSSPSIKPMHDQLNTAASTLISEAQAALDDQPAEAKKKLRTVLSIVDAKSPLRAKAQKLLSGN